MKLHLLLLPLALAACTSGENPGKTTADAATPVATQQAPAASSIAAGSPTLGRYHWVLTDATNADGMRIDALFARDDQPVQLDFVDDRLAISNSCNLMSGGYQLGGGDLSVEPMAQTEMACVEPKLAALDSEVSRRLQGKTRIEMTGGEDSPRLHLTTASGDKLAFAGKATADSRYGAEGEQVFMEVAAETTPCDRPMIADKQCLQVRERTYGDNGVISSASADWEPLYQDIEGYSHEPGVRNVLRLKRYKVANPPADGSSTAYVLDMVVESEQVAR